MTDFFHPRSVSRRRLPLRSFAAVTTLALVAAGCASLASPDALPRPSTERIRGHVTTLASDAFEGRAPGTPGEDKTVAYLAAELQRMGLAPGNPTDASYFQAVPLVGLTSEVTGSFASTGLVPAAPGALDLAPINDYTALSRRVAPEVRVPASEVVFCGYGVTAPEYGWDDFKDVDVRGKTVLVLVGDPPVADPQNPRRLDAATFRGPAMTYYGRWTYKFEQASARGAAACFIIHEAGPAGYPFAVVGSTWGREAFDLRTPDGNATRVALEGWLTQPAATRLLATAGHDYTALKTAAARRDFRPVSLPLRADFTARQTIRDVASRNVVAALPGRDPAVFAEWIVLTAHWDHLGRDDKLKGDPIFNGASDNASGCAVMLEVAETLAQLPPERRPRRSLLFLFVTAEEKGLLGARHYAQSPLHPLARTLANLNLDGASTFGPTEDIEVIGAGATTIEDVAAEVARAQGRVLLAETTPEKGYYYRSDHFEFAKVGVPAFYPKKGSRHRGETADHGARLAARYTAEDYHKVTDEIKPDWDFTGLAQDTEFLATLTLRLADGTEWPEWRAGSEFKSTRDAMLAR